MGVIIKGTDDTVKAADGSLSIEGFSIKTTGIGTFDGGIQVGSAATIHSNGNLGLTGIITATNFKTGDSNVHNTGYNVGSAITMQGNGNIAVTGIITASSYIGDGSALTGIAGTEITDSDFQVGVSTFFVDYTAGRVGVGTDVPARQFDVYSPTSGVNLITLRTGAGAYGQAGIAFASNPTASREKAAIFFQERTGGAHHAGDLVFSVDNAGGDAGTAELAEERVRIQGAGHVGIGTSMPTDRAASSNTRILNVGIVTTNTVYASTFVPSEGQLANRSVIINGAMQISQRGTSATSVGNQNGYGAWPDRFREFLASTANAGVWTISQDSESPDGFGFSTKWDCTTAGTLAAGSYGGYEQYIEGFNVQRFAKGTSGAKPGVLSFYVKTNKTGTYAVEFRDNDNSRMVGGTYTVGDTNWNRYEVAMPADTTGAWGDDNGSSLWIRWWLVAGSNFTSGTARTAWAAGASDDVLAVGQTVDLSDSTSNEWHITGVQLEVGSVATPFEHRNYGDELARCQRYYEAVYMNAGTHGFQSATSYGGQVSNNIFAVTKRAQPTFSLEGNASWVGATPNAFTDIHNFIFHHGSTAYTMSDTGQDLCGSFSCEL